MELQRGFDNPAAYRGGYVSIGNFDGVHRGHQSIVSVLVAQARQAGVTAVVLTFDPHPIHLLRPQHAPPSLSTIDRKAELLQGCGVDCVIAYPTDEALLDLTPEQFFERIIRSELNVLGLVEGPNFFFGRDRAGDIETLHSLCDGAGLSLDVVPALQFGDRMVSSSAIRSDIAAGRVSHAVDLLGHPYRLQGNVVKGAERGSVLGFPTANLEQIETLLPADGVYAGMAQVSGTSLAAAVNIGHNPTFDEAMRKVEVHLIDFNGDLYGERLEVDLFERVRDIVQFDSVEALKQQLLNDVEQVRAVAKRQGGR
ncbi:MAG: bifunctional riboflavin kinase/FAD synthetase [Planctomycetaceae bacterium]|jgi:riboflavin kinase / FMN adenylyltransferase|nr:bifunctional riboflavin kinase/FAD synthetase [Planctomycetaceae bacterium]MBT6154312.1 bifunctional riboflavin kinase/FAD synthetase [Planctomycetaceae bacterium]MBT6485612.1 bifunctional riboflavin kinase/FAD synthetase [Planctomycetaceae bacterium]MBT6495000.1 bifunctional riboflavin kinase/FAD synthetase [Planctomycetaceae bacterium]